MIDVHLNLSELLATILGALAGLIGGIGLPGL